ncbi:hypothetical protein PtA15_2A735 [Puccinia triticina]|uniref:Enoyl reductase (ER) domain-containing protein n=1 Tax=Puccinia triticina TaxID=208348 RepID=A0ABY7CB53_9BASI|nr:uncharacterized protein PtA15_2A735 [Puccinia triticina]WAQ82418.1 hypothetical protein PtA15_2A735 [Puccinia triticina]
MRPSNSSTEQSAGQMEFKQNLLRTIIKPSHNRFARPAAAASHHTLAKAITYTQNGDPTKVLVLKKFTLGPPKGNELGLRFRLSTLNTIQGRYPWKPEIRKDLIKDEQFYVAGNEGLAEVVSLGAEVDPKHWKIGDWVLMGKPQLGTWQSHTNLAAEDVIKLPNSERLSETQAATMSVNMSTAYRMIKDYLPQPSSPDTWIIQNGANSSVGQYLLQLCKAWDLGCIGLIRDRPNVEDLKRYLTRLGSDNKTTIMTYEELTERPKPSKPITLGLNCVSGNAETVGMMKWMLSGSRLITYGGMSMKPLVVPTSLLIFRNLKLEGFMLTNWRMKASKIAYREMLEDLVRLIDRGHLVEHENATIVDLHNDQAESIVRETVKESMSGRSGKKFLFRFI